MAALFCILWIGQISDFKSLNNAKFNVLNNMAPHIEFDSENPDMIVSCRPFEKEWVKLEELKALQNVGKTNIIALKSSNFEYYIPKAFRVIFIAIFLTIIIFILPNWKSYSDLGKTTTTKTNTTNQEIKR